MTVVAALAGLEDVVKIALIGRLASKHKVNAILASSVGVLFGLVENIAASKHPTAQLFPLFSFVGIVFRPTIHVLMAKLQIGLYRAKKAAAFLMVSGFHFCFNLLASILNSYLVVWQQEEDTFCLAFAALNIAAICTLLVIAYRSTKHEDLLQLSETG
ncbi:hypothetical protein Q5H91_06780 [Sphingomonas sp. KR1UV-12]|uniref:GDT1 family protein n=1 Tax=Sphingomonas aurea TaxID=3063994 RepID=A0ABT9EIX6_9SPHN|nr:hypothetical protein [Sphingomonas sp. KR1UV-12]MDP1026910.1 hypothetical protein [Sphingomonas sp. KR1UV-12]